MLKYFPCFSNLKGSTSARSKFLMKEMFLHNGDILSTEIVAKVRKFKAHNLFSHGVTDMFSQHQNVLCIMFFDEDLGNVKTESINHCDLLSGDEVECSADSKTMFDEFIEKLEL